MDTSEDKKYLYDQTDFFRFSHAEEDIKKIQFFRNIILWRLTYNYWTFFTPVTFYQLTPPNTPEDLYLHVHRYSEHQISRRLLRPFTNLEKETYSALYNWGKLTVIQRNVWQ
jgi:hypothetical protein